MPMRTRSALPGEIRRQLLRFYGVREVEISNFATMEESI